MKNVVKGISLFIRYATDTVFIVRITAKIILAIRLYYGITIMVK